MLAKEEKQLKEAMEMPYKNMRNIEKIMNLYSSLAADIANIISFDAVCKLDTYELKSLSLYATNAKKVFNIS